MWHLKYRPEIEDDVCESATWYDDKRLGLGDEFIADYVAAILRIQDNPLLFAVAQNGLRPCRLKRFPYIIHFKINGDDLLIVALMRGGRDDSSFIYRR
jgi:hypothetical protein